MKKITITNPTIITEHTYAVIVRDSSYGDKQEMTGSLYECVCKAKSLNRDSTYFFYEILHIATQTIMRA